MKVVAEYLGLMLNVQSLTCADRQYSYGRPILDGCVIIFLAVKHTVKFTLPMHTPLHTLQLLLHSWYVRSRQADKQK